MIAGFISAIINFGHEIIAQPQRVDFGDIAMSFFSVKIREKVFWFAILSDVSDPRYATINFLKKFVKEAEDLLLEISAVEGFTILSKDVEENLNGITEKIIKRSTRLLPEIRSDDKKVLPFSILTTLIAGMFIDVLFYSIYSSIPSSAVPLLTTALLAEYGLIGLIAGWLSCRRIAGGITAFIVSLLIPLMFIPDIIQIVIIASSLGVWSAIIGALIGSFFNTRTLTVLRYH